MQATRNSNEAAASAAENDSIEVQANGSISSEAYASSSSLGAIPTAIHNLKSLQINFVALDFDQTILKVHTGGRWPGTEKELLEHVRPVFWELIPELQLAGIEVAVVTFSRQISLVRGVLDAIMTTAERHGVLQLPNPAKPSGRIPIRGNDHSWKYTGKGSQRGKQPHMASAVEELEYR
ncbi:MAG: hypothetical protein SGILL_004898, partial [Bacillariaceae sp.]